MVWEREASIAMTQSLLSISVSPEGGSARRRTEAFKKGRRSLAPFGYCFLWKNRSLKSHADFDFAV